MPSYLIISFTPKDLVKNKIYTTLFNESLLNYQVEYLYKGPIENLNGNNKFEMQLILAFAMKKDALCWYNSKEYQALFSLREESMESEFLLMG